MKRAILLIVVLALILSCSYSAFSSEPLKLPEVPSGYADNLLFTYDKFQDSYLIQAKPELLSSNYQRPRLELWVEYTRKGKAIYLVMTYTGKSFLDLEYGVVLANGNRYETTKYSFLSENVKHEIITGGVSETIKMPDFHKSIGRLIIEIWIAKKGADVEYRFYGYRDSATGVMTDDELKAWVSVYDYYSVII